MGIELRCAAKLHGILINSDTLEVKCNSRWCGAEAGKVVLHKINLHTGAVETKQYKEPPQVRKEQDGTS